MPCGWEGNRRSGVALAMRHRLQWFIHLRVHGLDTEMSTPPMLSCGIPKPGARSTEYLTKDARMFLGTIHLKNRKIVCGNVCKLAYEILKGNLITL